MRIKPSIRILIAAAVFLPALALVPGCSTDSPTAPTNQLPNPPGTGNPPNASFNITVTATPPELEIGEGRTSNIRIVVRRADTGQVPADGTTVVVSTTLGDLAGLGQSIVASLLGGVTNITFFPGDIPGIATITGQLQSSFARATIRVFDRGTFFVSAVQPAVGGPEGGDEVTVLGGGFAPPVRVAFGGRNAQVLAMAPNSIRVLTPPFSTSAPVQVDVEVTINLNEADEASDAISSAFTYTPGGDQPVAPAIFGIVPSTGPNEGGTQITITGQSFQAPLQVLFESGSGAIEATVLSVTPTQIVAVTPPALGIGQDLRNQTVSVRVRVLNSGLQAVLGQAFTFGVELAISSFSPLEGDFSGGDIVTISGAGFTPPVQVRISGVEQLVGSVTGTEVQFTTAGIQVTSCPANGIAQQAPVEVTLVGVTPEQTVSSSQNFRYTVQLPQVLSLSPGSGTQNGGTNITVNGLGFEAPVQVRFSHNGQTFVGSVGATTATTVAVTTPMVTDAALDVTDCDNNNDGQVGEQFVATGFDVAVVNIQTGCVSPPLPNGFIFNPTDTSCRGDVAMLPECSDGIDNDGDTFIDLADPECTGPTDDDESM